MPQIINTNITSLNAQRNLNASQSTLTTAMQRLSSGLRVNSSKDDAAGLAIAERMNAQVRGMGAAIRNANDGISMAQTAEGSLSKITDALQRMRELSVQAANASNSDSDRDSLDKEFGELAKELQRVIGATNFNGKYILAANAGVQTFQIGANTKAEDTIDVTTVDLTSAGTPEGALMTVISGTDINGTGRAVIDRTSTVSSIHTVMDNIDAALQMVNDTRATLGASQARFESIISNLQVSVENQANARSRIMDADYAAETAQLSRAQILQQAGTAMVAQANQMPQQVLKLLQG